MIRKNIFESAKRGVLTADELVRIVIDALVSEIDSCPVDEDGKFASGNTYRLPTEIDKIMLRFEEELDEFDAWEQVDWVGNVWSLDETRKLNSDEEYWEFEFRESDGEIHFRYRHRRFYEFGITVHRPRRDRGEKGFFTFRGQLNKGLVPPPPKTIGGWIDRSK